MDWAIAIDRHRQALLRIVATLYVMIGLTDGVSIDRLPRPLHRMVLALLRPAEAAVRRLIIVLARDLVVKPRSARPAPAGLVVPRKGKTRTSFRLFDRHWKHDDATGRPSVAGPGPRIHFFDVLDPRSLFLSQFAPPAPVPVPEPMSIVTADTVNAGSLCRRLAAIKGALKGLAQQARRYARWRAKAGAEQNSQLEKKFRLRRLPGLGRKPSHEVQDILTECDWLARTALRSNTS